MAAAATQTRNNPTDQRALEQRIEERIDLPTVRSMEMQQLAGGAAFIPQNVAQMLEIAKMMATAKTGVRKHLRLNPGACLAVVMQAARWAMDPYAVANKSYEVNDQIAFEAQLITAVINTRAPIVGRLKTRFTGEGQNRQCVAYATLIGESEITEVVSPPFSQIHPKNSPLWKTDPDQQLAYYTKRAWARRECPEVLLGVYDVEEAQAMRDVTPPQTPAAGAPARPARADFAPAKPTATDVDPTTGEVIEEGRQQQAGSNQAAAQESVEQPAADTLEALDPKWQEWVADIEAKAAAIDSLGDLAELQQQVNAEINGGLLAPPALAQELATTAIQLRQRQIAGGGAGRR